MARGDAGDVEVSVELLGQQLREKLVEMFVLVEHLAVMADPTGLSVFGNLCQMASMCCHHVAMGRREQAIFVATTIGRAVPHAFPVGRERHALEDSIEEVIAVLERPDASEIH